MNISNSDCAWRGGGTTDVTNARTCHFFVLCCCLFDCFCSNFNIWPLPSDSMKKKSNRPELPLLRPMCASSVQGIFWSSDTDVYVRSELIMLQCSFPLSFYKCTWIFFQEKKSIRKKCSKYTLNSEPKALTGDKSEGIKSRGAAEAFIRGFSPVKAEGEEFNVLILSYTRELFRPFKENKG